MKNRAILSLAARVHEEGRRSLVAAMKEAGLEELTTSCGDIFEVLFREEGQTLTAVAEKIRRTKSTACVMVDRLEKQGYVVKTPSESDGRASVIRLTDKGRALRPLMDEISDRMNELLCRGLTEAEADQLEALLGKMTAAFGPAECTLDERKGEGRGCCSLKALKD